MEDSKLIGYKIKRIAHLFKRQLDKRFNIDLNFNQRFILNFIIENNKKGIDVFQKDIEKKFNIRRSTATVILQTLEKNNYIKRESVSYDARLKKIVPIYVFDKKEFKKIINEVESVALKGIKKEELNNFLSVLQMIENNLRKEDNDDKDIN